MSEHKAREARHERMTTEAKDRAGLLAIGAAFLLMNRLLNPHLKEERRTAIEFASELLDEAEVFTLAELAKREADEARR